MDWNETAARLLLARETSEALGVEGKPPNGDYEFTLHGVPVKLSVTDKGGKREFPSLPDVTSAVDFYRAVGIIK